MTCTATGLHLMSYLYYLSSHVFICGIRESIRNWRVLAINEIPANFIVRIRTRAYR